MFQPGTLSTRPTPPCTVYRFPDHQGRATTRSGRPARTQVPGQPAAATCFSQSLSHACESPSHLKARAQIRPLTRTARLPGRPASAALHQTRPRAPDTRSGHPIKHLPTSPAAPGTAPWASAEPPIAPLSGALASRALRPPVANTALVTSRADILAIRPFTTASPRPKPGHQVQRARKPGCTRL